MTPGNFLKRLWLIALLGASLALAACGESDDADEAKPADSAPAPILNPIGLARPDVQPPPNPPTELVIRDIKQGKGSPPSRKGDELTTEYYAVDQTGKVRYSSWDNVPPFHFSFRLGAGNYMRGLEEGLEGMKVGGRRELLIPPRLTDTSEPLYYVVDLLELNREEICWSVQRIEEATPKRQREIYRVCGNRTHLR